MNLRTPGEALRIEQRIAILQGAQKAAHLMAALWASTNKMPEPAASTAADTGGNSCNGGVMHVLTTHRSPDVGRREFECLCLPLLLL